MKFLKTTGIVAIVIIIGFFVIRTYHFSYTVNTWDGWCSQITGEDLFEKYNTFAISFDHNGIRADFVQKYNDFISERIAEKYLAGAKLDDPVVQELMRLKMIGVYNEGDDLYLSNHLLIVEEYLGIDDFQEWENNFRSHLDIEQNRQDLSDFQYCIYGTINTHFKNFILKGPDDKSITIPLEFTREESFK